jgi:hypothetical protein
MHPDTSYQLANERIARFHAEADAQRLASRAGKRAGKSAAAGRAVHLRVPDVRLLLAAVITLRSRASECE